MKVLAFLIAIPFIMPSSAINFGIHCDGVELINEFGIDSFIEECKKKGYNKILFNVMPWDYYFISPTLQKLGWEYGGDLLSSLIQKAHENGIAVYADIQTLAWKYRDNYENPGTVPNEEDIEKIVDELVEYGIDGISEEMFPAQWMSIVYQKCEQHGIEYIHKHIPYDVAWFSSDGSNVFNAYSNCSILMTEDYYMNDDLPRWQMAAGFANALHKQLWIKSCPDDWALNSITNMENVMVARAIQYGSRNIFAMIYDRQTFEEFEPKEVENFIEISHEEKPVFNVVIYLTNSPEDMDAWQLFDISYAAIANAAEASGYVVYITEEPLKNASTYYIYTRGEMNTSLDLPSSFIQLFNESKTVFLQIAYGLPLDVQWMEIRKKFGIGSKDFETLFGKRRIKAEYDGKEYYYLSDDWYLFNSITSNDVMEAVSTGKFNGKEYVFIARNGSRVFINGAGLDEEACYPISNILNDALQNPFHGICGVGKKSVFYTYNNTTVQIKFPYDVKNIEYIERDVNGNVVNGSMPYYGIFGYELKKGSLLILNLTISNPEPKIKIMKPGNYLYINDREIIPLASPVVIGKITITMEMENISHEEIYVDEELKYKGNTSQWLFNEPYFGSCEIRVIGYGYNKKCEDDIEAFIMNL